MKYENFLNDCKINQIKLIDIQKQKINLELVCWENIYFSNMAG